MHNSVFSFPCRRSLIRYRCRLIMRFIQFTSICFTKKIKRLRLKCNYTLSLFVHKFPLPAQVHIIQCPGQIPT